MKHRVCDAPVVPGKKRFYRHGGAPGSGAPKGSQNAYKHGLYSRHWIEEGRNLRYMIKAVAVALRKRDQSSGK
jgi:hypothetical protein